MGGLRGEEVGQVADHFESVIRPSSTEAGGDRPFVRRPPTEILAGRGLAAVSVAIAPAPFAVCCRCRSPRSRAASPALEEPGERHEADAAHVRPVPLRVRERRLGGRGQGAVREFAVPAPAKPLFQAASANLNPWTEVKVDTENPDRGPLLLL